MSSDKAVTVEQARAKLGDLVIKAMRGETTVITRYGKPVAQITPYTQESAMTSYIAAIATAADVVAGNFCDVSVIECEEASIGIDDDGNEILEQQMTDRVAMPAQETTVLIDDADSAVKVEDDAERILVANGWRVTGKWEPSDNAIYATVELA